MQDIQHTVFFAVLLTIIMANALVSVAASSDNEKGSSMVATEAFFTLTYQGEQKEYSLADLETLEEYTGTGGHLKVTGDITGPFEYTGVRVLTLLNQVPNLPETYKVITLSNDGYLYTFSYQETRGDVTVYDSNGNYVGRGGVVMLLAYKEKGDYDFYGGPLRITWVNGNNAVTEAPLWPKYITEVEIIKPLGHDTTPPHVIIEKPNNHIYLFDREIMPSSIPIIIGPITIEVSAYDMQSAIAKTLIIIDEDLKYRSMTPPFQWHLDTRTLGIHTITSKAYDIHGNSADDQIKTWIFNL